MFTKLAFLLCTHRATAAAPRAPAADASWAADAALARLDKISYESMWSAHSQDRHDFGLGICSQRHVRPAAQRERHCARGYPALAFAARCAPLVQTPLHPRRRIFCGPPTIFKLSIYCHLRHMLSEMFFLIQGVVFPLNGSLSTTKHLFYTLINSSEKML